jgi:GNAT superfamily N-acetyltransferase
VREAFQIRPATIADAHVVAHHRASMFHDMGALPSPLVQPLKEMTLTYLEDAMPRGEYFGWLAAPSDDAARIVAGAGVQVRRVLPFPQRWIDRPIDSVGFGRQAIVLNVYTEPAFRRRGLAREVMLEILTWARSAGIESLVLHAAPAGRRLYEALGFAATNEMRFSGELAMWTRPVGLPRP